MALGLQLVAPKGFRNLVADRRYHLLHRDNKLGRVVLAYFEQLEGAFLTYIDQDKYDYAREMKLLELVPPKDTCGLPPWLSDREGEVFKESSTVQGKELREGAFPQWHVAETRENIIEAAAADYENIFSQPDPIRELNRLARARGQVAARFRRWVITYLAFGGKNKWVLLPPGSGRGKYSREAIADQGRPTGRPDLYGPDYGCATSVESKELIKKGFLRYAKKGKPLTEIHADVVTYLFKADVVKHGDRTEVVQIDPRLPYPPTYGTFNYWVIKILTHKTVWSTILGDQEYRNRFEPTVGSYSESLSDLFERVMSDATAAPQLARSYLHDATTLPLYIVECVDVLTGAGIGVAFGVGSETEALYQQCLASVALRMSLIGRLFNMEISDEEFPIHGYMPLSHQTDQGKGATKKLIALNEEFGISPERSPSYTPQSQANIEAAHADRSVKVAGAPTREVSKLTAFEMARHMLIEFLSRNRSRGILNRLTPELVARGIQSPLEFVRHLIAEGRISATPVKAVDVITKYLPKVTFEVDAGRLVHDGVIYRPARLISDDDRALEPHEVGEIARKIQKSKLLAGYRFEISNLVEWVVVGRQLIEVHAIPRSAEHLSRTAMTTQEGALHAKKAAANATITKKLLVAERVRVRIEAEQTTGKKFLQSTTRKGKARVRTDVAKKEAAALRED